ncbi:MAG: chorismate mutase [Planctomycetota bacterium]
MACRGVRGATTADDNTAESILKATRELLALMIRLNDIHEEDVASAVFTTSSDLNAEFPALAARQLGWFDTALMCQNELDVPGSLRHCIRILITWNTDKQLSEVVHIYVKGAANLRPDRSQLPTVDWKELDGWIESHIHEVARPKRD